MKTLVIVTHPALEKSVINKRWIEELEKHPEKYHIHSLHEVYPDEKIDVLKEQQLLESFDHIVFQFPFYWFNCPPLLKKWLDEVLTHGWAYGSKSGYKLGGKKIALAISAGIEESGYTPEGKYKYTMETLTTPFQITFEYVKADYKGIYVYYDIEQNSSPEWIEQSVAPFLGFIDNLS
ncbi:NAD(P)H-dependent oxidoreductase [Chitinophaga deserti]|uniref:NAD(P)H-dependent oxidoreductase n=1 Tax=Chitinophaga deserti TaxID=2164099 RepID=UPI000D6D7482|nr:NAD(P)H-dependent oxidoreductase [Chitinophaga deserti]